MALISKKQRAVCAAVKTAFRDVPYPGDDNIGLIAKSTGTARAREAKAIFRGKHWEDILERSNNWFRSHYWVLSSLSPSGFHFFLPAFVIKSVTDTDKIDLVPEWIVYSLMPPLPQRSKIWPSHRKRMAQFDSKQKEALKKFLKFLKHRKSNEDGYLVRCINETIALMGD